MPESNHSSKHHICSIRRITELYSTSNYVQEAVSIVYLENPNGYYRIACRGGTGDTYCYGPTLSTCDSFCNYVENTNNPLDTSYTTPIPYAYYAKCYNESVSQPPNGKRFSFASQIGTTELDPALQPINTPNQTTCRRKILFFQRILFLEILFLQDTNWLKFILN